jgi:hypothetical protein
MKKGIIVFCLILLAFASGVAIKPSHAAQETAVVGINPANLNLTTAYVGETIQLNVNISNVQGLWGWAIQNVNFNPKVLNITNVQEGPFLNSKDSTFFLWSFNSTLAFSKGDIPEINCAFAEDQTVSGSGGLATITFTVIAAGTSPITMGEVALMSDLPSSSQDENNEISCTWTNSTVTVNALTSTTPAPGLKSPTPSPNSGASAPGTPTPQQTFTSGNPPTSSPDGANNSVGSNNSNTYLYLGIVVAAVVAVLATVVFVRRRK